MFSNMRYVACSLCDVWLTNHDDLSLKTNAQFLSVPSEKGNAMLSLSLSVCVYLLGCENE